MKITKPMKNLVAIIAVLSHPAYASADNDNKKILRDMNKYMLEYADHSTSSLTNVLDDINDNKEDSIYWESLVDQEDYEPVSLTYLRQTESSQHRLLIQKIHSLKALPMTAPSVFTPLAENLSCMY